MKRQKENESGHEDQLSEELPISDEVIEEDLGSDIKESLVKSFQSENADDQHIEDEIDGSSNSVQDELQELEIQNPNNLKPQIQKETQDKHNQDRNKDQLSAIQKTQSQEKEVDQVKRAEQIVEENQLDQIPLNFDHEQTNSQILPQKHQTTESEENPYIQTNIQVQDVGLSKMTALTSLAAKDQNRHQFKQPIEQSANTSDNNQLNQTGGMIQAVRMSHISQTQAVINASNSTITAQNVEGVSRFEQKSGFIRNSNEFEQNDKGQFDLNQNQTPTDQTITPREAAFVYQDDSSAVQGFADDELGNMTVLSNDEKTLHESKEAEDEFVQQILTQQVNGADSSGQNQYSEVRHSSENTGNLMESEEQTPQEDSEGPYRRIQAPQIFEEDQLENQQHLHHDNGQFYPQQQNQIDYWDDEHQQEDPYQNLNQNFVGEQIQFQQQENNQSAEYHIQTTTNDDGTNQFDETSRTYATSDRSTDPVNPKLLPKIQKKIQKDQKVAREQFLYQNALLSAQFAYHEQKRADESRYTINQKKSRKRLGIHSSRQQFLNKDLGTSKKYQTAKQLSRKEPIQSLRTSPRNDFQTDQKQLLQSEIDQQNYQKAESLVASQSTNALNSLMEFNAVRKCQNQKIEKSLGELCDASRTSKASQRVKTMKMSFYFRRQTQKSEKGPNQFSNYEEKHKSLDSGSRGSSLNRVYQGNPTPKQDGNGSTLFRLRSASTANVRQKVVGNSSHCNQKPRKMAQTGFVSTRKRSLKTILNQEDLSSCNENSKVHSLIMSENHIVGNTFDSEMPVLQQQAQGQDQDTIFHEDPTLLQHEMIDQEKVIKKMSQLEGKGTKFGRSNLQEIFEKMPVASARQQLINVNVQGANNNSETNENEIKLGTVQLDQETTVQYGQITPKDKFTEKQKQKRQKKEWSQFMSFLKKNPEKLMNLMESHAPSVTTMSNSKSGATIISRHQNLMKQNSGSIMSHQSGMNWRQKNQNIAFQPQQQIIRQQRPQSSKVWNSRPFAMQKANHEISENIDVQEYLRGTVTDQISIFDKINPADRTNTLLQQQESINFGKQVQSITQVTPKNYQHSVPNESRTAGIQQQIRPGTFINSLNLRSSADAGTKNSQDYQTDLKANRAGNTFSEDPQIEQETEITSNAGAKQQVAHRAKEVIQKGYNTLLTGSLDQALIPIEEEETRGRYTLSKKGMKPNFSQSNIKSNLLRGKKMRNISSAHPERRVNPANNILLSHNLLNQSTGQQTSETMKPHGLKTLMNSTMVGSPMNYQTVKASQSNNLTINFKQPNSRSHTSTGNFRQVKLKRSHTACTDKATRQAKKERQREEEFRQLNMSSAADFTLEQKANRTAMGFTSPDFMVHEQNLIANSTQKKWQPDELMKLDMEIQNPHDDISLFQDKFDESKRQQIASRSTNYKHRQVNLLNQIAKAKELKAKKIEKEKLEDNEKYDIHGNFIGKKRSLLKTCRKRTQMPDDYRQDPKIVVKKEVPTKKLIWNQLSVAGLQQKANILFSTYPLSNAKKLEKERQKMEAWRNRPKPPPYSLARDMMKRFGIEKEEEMGGDILGQTRAQLLEMERIANLTPPSHTSSQQREKWVEWKQEVVNFRKDLILLEFNKKKEMATMQEIIESINYLKQ